jgi:UDP-glucose:(glucosyl)LPS alpha-1,2-glucosyltransferase
MPADPAGLPVAIVLPPREGFGPGPTGAVGLIAHRLAAAPSDSEAPPFRPSVIGGQQRGELFGDVPFHPAKPVAWLPVNPNRRYAAGVARLLRGLRPALVEVHNRTEIALDLARGLRGVPVSLFLHNDPQGMGGLATPRARAEVLRRLARVVTVSEFVRARMLDAVPLPLPGPAPFVLPNCIDFADLPEPLPPGRRENLILFAGRLVPEKGPDTFVSACAVALRKLTGWRAEMIGADRFRAGGADTRLIAALRPRAEAAGVRMLGYQPHAAVLAAMARATIVVVPSRWQEPFGLAALEAMASGAALVCSPRGGLPEVGGDAVCYADPEDPEAVAAAILALAKDPAYRNALARAGLARARFFDLPATAHRLHSLRREILRDWDARPARS